MRAVSDWLTRCAWQAMAFALGTMLGLVLILPIGWHLPDVYANIFGGVIGAIASIAGAFLVLNRQIAAAEKTRLADQAERLQSAVASALIGDLSAAKVFCQTQLTLANGGFVAGARMQNRRDMKIWCERQVRMPMVAFDRLNGILNQLGNISGPLIHVYSEAARISSLLRGQLDTMADGDDLGPFVCGVAELLPQFVINVETAINVLRPHYAVALVVEAQTHVGSGVSGKAGP